MSREFNITGTCIPHKHFMADTSEKLEQITELIDKGHYFTINRPRQYGKTTTMYLLEEKLKKSDYYIIRISFEGIGDSPFENEKRFSKTFISQLIGEFKFLKDKRILDYIEKNNTVCNDLKELSLFITDLVQEIGKRIVLMIDEVDKSSNNQLFLSFLGILRTKYLLRKEDRDYTFHSIILAGVHDVKTLKLKIRDGKEEKFNSPWNIAIDFDIDMSFNPKEIATMLVDYTRETQVKMDIPEIAGKLYYYTSGYPFLVSRLCKIIDEKILVNKTEKKWEENDITQAVNIMLGESNTNFDSLIKNLENNEDLYANAYDIVIEGASKTFNNDNPVIKSGEMYGIFRDEGIVKIHNRIYEQRIYNYMSSKIETSMNIDSYSYRENFIKNRKLDFEKLLVKFQLFMKEQYNEKDEKFLERNGRLIFLAFLKPIINGYGYDFKEVQISEEKRLDVVVTFYSSKYVVELKLWKGDKAHKKGLKQLSGYLDRQNLSQGYLVIFNKNKKKAWKQAKETVDGKNVFAIWV
ncbi:MAG: AAA-like domain-containing protein [Bacteroidetes bacterium]|nr:AAA-like domain-containing protein [Bacteroidota bacterium]